MSAGKVKLPQSDGEVTVTYGGDVDDAHTFKVTKGVVTARDDRDLRQLLLIEGAKQVEGDPPDDDGAAPAVPAQGPPLA